MNIFQKIFFQTTFVHLKNNYRVIQDVFLGWYYILNGDGSLAFKTHFKNVTVYSEGKYLLIQGKDRKYNILDENLNFRIQDWYNYVYLFENDDDNKCWCVVSYRGNKDVNNLVLKETGELISCEWFRSVYERDGRIIVSRLTSEAEPSYNYINYDGSFVFDRDYFSISLFAEDIASVCTDRIKKMGNLIDRTGKRLFEKDFSIKDDFKIYAIDGFVCVVFNDGTVLKSNMTTKA